MDINRMFDIILAGENFKDVAKYLYHATYKPLMKDIMIDGLKGGVNKNWEDSKSNLVYLSFTPEVAESYAETSDVVPEEWLDNIIILEIDTSKLDKSKLSSDSNVIDGDSTLEYDGVISPYSIRRYN